MNTGTIECKISRPIVNLSIVFDSKLILLPLFIIYRYIVIKWTMNELVDYFMQNNRKLNRRLIEKILSENLSEKKHVFLLCEIINPKRCHIDLYEEISMKI